MVLTRLNCSHHDEVRAAIILYIRWRWRRRCFCAKPGNQLRLGQGQLFTLSEKRKLAQRISRIRDDGDGGSQQVGHASLMPLCLANAAELWVRYRDKIVHQKDWAQLGAFKPAWQIGGVEADMADIEVNLSLWLRFGLKQGATQDGGQPNSIVGCLIQ